MAFVNSDLFRADSLYIKEFIRKFLIRVLDLDLDYFLRIDSIGDITFCFSIAIDDIEKFAVEIQEQFRKKDSYFKKNYNGTLSFRHIMNYLCDNDNKKCWEIFREYSLSVLNSQGAVTVPQNNSFQNAEKKLSEYLGIDREWLDFLTVYAVISRKRCVYGLLEDMHLDNEGSIEEFSYCFGFSADRFKKIGRALLCQGFFKNLSDDFQHRLSEKIVSTYDPFLQSDPSKWFEKLNADEKLKTDDFQIDKKSLLMLKRMLDGSLEKKNNILLYGEPGAGKTSLVRSLARELGVTVFSVTSDVGDNDRDRRLSLTACVKFAKRYRGKTAVLVDEAERLLATDVSYDSGAKDKAWLNAFLENNEVNMVFITNQIEHVDQAVRRRFDYSLYFPKLNKKQQKKIWEFVIDKYEVRELVTARTLDTFLKEFDVPVSVIDRCVLCAKNMCGQSKSEFCSVLRSQLEAYTVLREDGEIVRKLKNSREKKDTVKLDDYSSDAVNFNCDINKFIEGFKKLHLIVKSSKNPEKGMGTMLFYGPPGTGKTELAHYLAKITKRKAVIKKASDLLSCYVGVSEQLVAETFNNLDLKKEILVIDEVDSFLYDRAGTKYSWEKTLVNEFLTQLQEFRGILICTTNLVRGLDPAVMRRFTTKLEFKYSEGKQLDVLYDKLLKPLSGKELSDDEMMRLHKMRNLTPGDFHVVKGKFSSIFYESENPSNGELLRALEQETGFKENKQGTRKRIGFI